MATRIGLDIKKIVATAAELADKHGLHELNMSTLATALGIRPPTLYHYFAGLDGLRRALALLGLQEAESRLGRAVMGIAGDDAVFALAHALRTFAKERPGIYEAAQRAPGLDDEEWYRAGQEVVNIMLLTFSAYHLTSDEAYHAVRMVRILVHGCTSLERAGGFGLPLEVDETFQRLLTTLIQSLHKTR
jgi:AcrR family transcriptional regulator